MLASISMDLSAAIASAVVESVLSYTDFLRDLYATEFSMYSDSVSVNSCSVVIVSLHNGKTEY